MDGYFVEGNLLALTRSKIPITQPQNKNLVVTFFALIKGVCMQNFSYLASKLRMDFEVTYE